MIKSIQYILGLFLLLGVLSCTEKELDPVLSVLNPPTITSPSAGSSMVFLEAEAADPFTVNWSAAEFTLNNVSNTTYELQMDLAGNNFASARTLTTTTDLSYPNKIGGMNDLLTLMGVPADAPASLELRVSANIDGALDNIYSDVVTITVTPYTTFVYIKPIYLLGSATTAGWDNNDGSPALEVPHVGDGKFEIVTTLKANEWLKFVSVRGQWAPQWGTDGDGTSESGSLVLRPTESDPDPGAIPSPAVESQYKIIADTASLTYEIFEYGDVYILGDATAAGWDNTIALPMAKIEEGKYSITSAFVGGGIIKVIDERGAWAPQWGTDDTGTNTGGPLVHRPTEDDPDPAGIPGPDAGTYTLEIDIVNLTYTITQ